MRLHNNYKLIRAESVHIHLYLAAFKVLESYLCIIVKERGDCFIFLYKLDNGR